MADAKNRDASIALYFPAARLIRVNLGRVSGDAVFIATLTEKVRVALNWGEIRDDDGRTTKRTKLNGTRLVFKQSDREIGKHPLEADLEITSIEKFQVYRHPLKGGKFSTRVRFNVKFECLDGGENLEPLLKRVVKPGSLTLFYKPAEPSPEQLNLPGDQRQGELISA